MYNYLIISNFAFATHVCYNLSDANDTINFSSSIIYMYFLFQRFSDIASIYRHFQKDAFLHKPVTYDVLQTLKQFASVNFVQVTSCRGPSEVSNGNIMNTFFERLELN